jgi:hypothetical protein
VHRRRGGDRGGGNQEDHPGEPHPPGGGCRQDHAHGELVGDRLQPRQHAADGAGDGAGHVQPRRGHRVPGGAEGDADLRGHQRLQPRDGAHALRRELVGAPGGHGQAGREVRDQEHEHVQGHPPRADLRAGAAGGDAAQGRDAGAGDAALGRRGRDHVADALEGIRARLPLFSGAGPAAGGAGRGHGRGVARGAAGTAGGAARAVHRRVRPAGIRCGRADGRPGRSRTTSRRRRRRRETSRRCRTG